MVIVMETETGRILSDESRPGDREEVLCAGWIEGPALAPRLEPACAPSPVAAGGEAGAAACLAGYYASRR